MSGINFLTVEQVVELHRDSIRLHGGDDGLREPAALESAVHMPQAGLGGHFFHNGIHMMAAAYLFHLVQNHPFVDGNKRAGLAAAAIFLGLNNFSLTGNVDEVRDMVLAVARGEMEKDAIAAFFKANTRATRT